MDQENREKKIRLLQDLLKYPSESPSTDYKAAVKFKEDNEFALKLVKHILGMANAGGGFVVIGFSEDDQKVPVPDPKVSQKIVASYESTKLCQYVDKHIRGTDKIKLTVWKIPYNNKDYPIIEVFGFDKRPYFCKSTKANILKEGALYFRNKSSKTIELADPNEWEELIDLVVSNRQDDLLVRFDAMLEKVGFTRKIRIPISAVSKESKEEITTTLPGVSEWKKRRREELERLMEEHGFQKEYFEVVHWVAESQIKKWQPQELLSIAEKAVLHKTGWPIGAVVHNPQMKPAPVENGIKAVIYSKSYFPGFDYWYLLNDEAFYFARNYQEDVDENLKGKRILYFDTRIWRIAESIDHCISLYKAFNLDPTSKIRIQITHKGLKDRDLSASNPQRAITMFHERKCNADTVEWETEATLDELLTGRKSYIDEAVRKLLIMFDFFEPDPGVVESVLKEYEQSQF